MTSEAMNCNELVELVSEYLDNELDVERRARVDAHLVGCDGCQHYLEQFQVTVGALGRVTEEQLDPEFRAKLLAALRGCRD
ncbi:anti-sigma factor family protein [Mycobacterium simiae]|uniref:anti-sigma factor family protein n=1 Tax=Mycobacterium simiae TaxID=1784 RepID=UPI00262EBE89|nr:zf-HC2 domain-containing protein [Mycobacterium simiae]